VTAARRRVVGIGALAALVASVALGLIVFGGADRSPAPAPKLPFLTLPLLRDPSAELQLSTLRGPLVINFFFSECAPCVKELPILQAAAAKGMKIVGVDHGEPSADGLAIADRFGLGYRLLSDPAATLAPRLGVLAFPTSLFVDADGRVVARHVGAISASELSKRFDALGPRPAALESSRATDDAERAAVALRLN
jgi:thiol-disulfide isomerase/thioredoxin